jgi:hypothetical protein
MFASFGFSVILCVPFLVLFDPTPALYAGVLLGHAALSLAIFRYSRALFLAVDFYLDPGPPARGGDDLRDPAPPARPFPVPGTARRVPGRRQASRREREPADAR